ncbi:DUF3857 domain-containing protein [Chitinophaga barathri]|uniref:DUF3857 domain-containing protein n=1 Tax=Chitinophaga barathri TaxID=1647451 RepID=UPI0013C40326|nr:DUF3857 domain-containing protein [Chitinophaga barathri]
MTNAQDKTPVSFGKVKPEDFRKAPYKIDSSASAVVIADVGSTAFESGTDDFMQVYKIYQRIHILNKNGYDRANVSIYLHSNGSDEERMINLKAVTYNLENGEVVETKLESKSVFTEKLDKNSILKKFTLPAVKEGSIIEYSYTINSEFPHYLRPWSFQSTSAPVLWSEYEVTLPEYFHYIFLSQGYHPFHIKDSEDGRKTYSFRVPQPGGRSESVTVSPGITRHRWVMKDIPELKEENYVTTLSNHLSYIEFQLASVRFPDAPLRQIMSTWEKYTEELMKDVDYAADLDKSNGFLGDKVEELTKGVASAKEKAEKIYGYVRDNYTCTDYSALYTSQPLKTVFSKRNGNVADINLLLTAMLRKAGLYAVPVILSTRAHGKTYPIYPIRSKLNYTVVSLNVDGAEYYMDATRPYLGFGKLHASAYNGHARKVDVDATPLTFESDSLREATVAGIFISPNEKGGFEGHYQRQLTYFESYDLRSRIKEKGEEDYFKEVSKGFMSDIELKNGKIGYLKDYSEQAVVEYDFKLTGLDEGGMLYLHPMFSESMRTNPFKSAVRTYPVEMPAVRDVNFTLSLQVPDNYSVEEIPKSTIVKYNDGEGIFQYIVQQEGNLIQLRSRVKLSRALYEPEEYDSLREFFDVVVKKQAEQIVLKKKS